VSISVLEQARVQAQVLVPLIKTLQAELGEERANALVRKALRDLYRRYGEEFWKAKNERNLGKAVASAFSTYARDDALDYRIGEQSEDVFAIDVTRCRYAEFYRESRNSASSWSAARTLTRRRDLAATSSSRARRRSCKARATATSATDEPNTQIEGGNLRHFRR
jgi:hypothetical protein